MKKAIIRHTSTVLRFLKKKWVIAICILFVALAVLSKIGNANRPKGFQGLIESRLSHYDGSHNELEAYIKSKMGDPSSYEHIKTTYVIPKDQSAKTTIFTTTFRGKNALGVLVTNSISARCDIESGRVIEVLPQ